MVLGIDLGGTNIRIGQIENGEIVNRISEPNPSEMGLDKSLTYLKSRIRGMMNSNVTGIGIGVPSVVDVARGIVYNAANIPSWKKVHLKDILTDEFGVPVHINNDSNCFVLGEKEYGAGKNFRDIVGVTLGTGVGAGIVINSELYCGCNTGAGEIGSVPYRDATFEPYCSSTFFIRHYHTTGRETAAKAQQGNASALKIWNDFGVHVGQLMQTVLYTYDPELIVLGGGITKAFAFFKHTMHETVNEFPYPETVKNIRIDVSENPDISILGAAALVKN